MKQSAIFYLILLSGILYPMLSASAETSWADTCRDTMTSGVSMNIPNPDSCAPNLPSRLSRKKSGTIAGLCPVLREILLSAWKKFKPIRGKLDLVSEEYFGTLIPPGQKICFSWVDGSTYHCRSPEGLSLDEVGRDYDVTRRSIRQCLPDDWTAKETTVDRMSARRSTTYKSDSHRVEIQVGERNKRSGWQLVLYFRR
ncbi:MAG: hypothetical protein ACE5FZ_05005 [Nitrospiria bacterium]